MKAIQEEAEKYALHEVKHFFQSIVRTGKSFKEYYEGLDFDRLFFESILYTNPAITAEFSEKRLAIYRQNHKENALNTLINQEETRFLKELSRTFKDHFTAIYITETKRLLEECEEEMNWANDDIRYHEMRDYLQDKAFIGEVSEEERTKCIEEGQEKVVTFEAKKAHLHRLLIEMERVLTK